MARSKVKSRLHHITHYTPQLMSLPTINLSTCYTLQFLRYSPDNIVTVKVTTVRLKVKSRSHYDIAHLHPLTNAPTTYELPTPYSLRYSLAKIISATCPDTMCESNTSTAFEGVYSYFRSASILFSLHSQLYINPHK